MGRPKKARSSIGNGMKYATMSAKSIETLTQNKPKADLIFKTYFVEKLAQIRFFLSHDIFTFYVTPFFVLPLATLMIHFVILKLNSSEFDDPDAWLTSGANLTDVRMVRSTLDLITRDIVIILGLLVTSSFVVLQMFAANFLPHTISLFFRNKGVFFILSFMTLTAMFSGVVNAFVSPTFVVRIPAGVSYVVRFLSLSITFPYFHFLVNFLTPEALMRQVTSDGLEQIESLRKIAIETKDAALEAVRAEQRRSLRRSMRRVAPEDEDSVETAASVQNSTKSFRVIHEIAPMVAPNQRWLITQYQTEWIGVIELLGDIGLSTLKQKDKENANNAMLSLYTIACSYVAAKEKNELVEEWFELSTAVRSRPDFSSLSTHALDDMIRERTWAEWKIFRAYQLLFETASSQNSPHLCGLAAFYTRKMGELAVGCGDSATMGICIKFMNTYIRYLINTKDIRILSGVLNEYCELAKEFMRLGSVYKGELEKLESSDPYYQHMKPKPKEIRSSIVSWSSPSRRKSKDKAAALDTTQFALHKPSDGEGTGVQLSAVPSPKKTPLIKGLTKARLNTRSVKQRPVSAEERARLREEAQRKVDMCDSSLMSIVLHMRYYLVISSTLNLVPVSEMLAHDIATLCAQAYQTHCSRHEELLGVFLSLDDTQRGTSQVQAYRGIRRAQVKLASVYLVHGEVDLAKEIQIDMDDEPIFRIKHVYRELMNMDTEMFWEIAFRTQNLDYLSPAHKATLDTFFGWFTKFSLEEIKEGMGLNVQEALEHSDDKIVAKPSNALLQSIEAFQRKSQSLQSDDSISMLDSKELNDKTTVLLTQHESLSARLQRKHPLKLLALKLTIIGALSVVAALILDTRSADISGTFNSMERRTAENVSATLDVAGILIYVVLCVTSMIILQTVAARYKFHPDMLSFLRDPVLYSILCIIIVTCMLGTVTQMWISDSLVPRYSLIVSTTLITMDLVLLVVYFARLFDIFRPDCVLNQVRKLSFDHVIEVAKLGGSLTRSAPHNATRRNSFMAMECASAAKMDKSASEYRSMGKHSSSKPDRTKGFGKDNIEEGFMTPGDGASASKAELEKIRKHNETLDQIVTHQHEAHEQLKRICDFAFACVQQSDETNLLAAVSTLRWLIRSYSRIKPRLPDAWFLVRGRLRRTSDFINFPSDRIAEISESGIWFEFKLLSQFLIIFEECLKYERTEECQFVAQTVRAAAEGMFTANDYEAYQVAIKFLNTFLRRGINARNLQVIKFIRSQYEELFTFMIEHIKQNQGLHTMRGGRHATTTDWLSIISEDAWFLKYYAQVALEKDLGVFAEHVAISLSDLTSLAHRQGEAKLHLELLRLLLTLDDVTEGYTAPLVGVRRAQIKLAILYMRSHQKNFAQMIAKDMLEESKEYLAVIVDEILSTNRSEFWEASEEGIPFDFLDPEEKQALPKFFELLESLPEAKSKGITEYATEAVSASLAYCNTDATLNPRNIRDTHFLRQDRLTTKVSTISSERLSSAGALVAAARRTSRARLGRRSSSILPSEISDTDLEDFIEGMYERREGGRITVASLVYRVSVPVATGLALTVGVFVAVFYIAGSIDEYAGLIDRLAADFKDPSLPMEISLRAFSVVVMCSLIALQKSAARMVRHIWHLYQQSAFVRFTWTINLLAAVLALWCTLATREDDFSRIVLAACSLGLGALSVLTLYPYFSYLFVFLDEGKLLTQIVLNDLSILRGMSEREKHKVAGLQTQMALILNSMQRITDFASSTIRAKDKNNSLKCVSALYSIGRCYLGVKNQLPPEFFSLFLSTPSIALSPDFARLPGSFKDMMKQDRTWVEWKVLRQYLFLYRESIFKLNDVCYQVVISTRRLAESALRQADVAVLDLCLRCLNTFLKSALDRYQIRLAFGITYQYRKLAENIINNRLTCENSTTNMMSSTETEVYAVDVAWYLQHYSKVAMNLRVPFMQELIAHDIGWLCSVASKRNSRVHDRLLNIFLKSYDRNDSNGRTGVRRAQFKLAADYFIQRKEPEAKRLMDDIATEPDMDILVRAYVDLMGTDSNASFWEINERMYNIDHVSADQRSIIDKLVAQFLPPEVGQACKRSSERARSTKLDFQELPSNSPTIQKQNSVLVAKTFDIDSALSNFSRVIALRARRVLDRAARDGVNALQNMKRKNTITSIPSGADLSEYTRVSSWSRFWGRKPSSNVAPKSPTGSKGVDADEEKNSKEQISMHSMVADGINVKVPREKKRIRPRTLRLRNRMLAISWIPVTVIVAISTAAVLCSMAIDMFVSETWPGWGDILLFTQHLEEDTNRALKTLAKSSIVVYCLVLTPTLIMLQINSRHLLGVIAEQYFGDTQVYAMLMFYTTTCVFVQVAHFVSLSISQSPRQVLTMLSMITVFVEILLLFPYFATLFEFLDPHKVVGRMLVKLCVSIEAVELTLTAQPSKKVVTQQQQYVSRVIQQLTGFAGASIMDKDKHNFTNVVRVLCTFVDSYMQVKGILPEQWFDATTRCIRTSQDFSPLEQKHIMEMKEKRSWVEAMVLRQFVQLFAESMDHMEDGCLLVAIETVKIGQRAIEHRDAIVLALIVDIFNTYVRNCLNKRNIRSAYNTLHQYRQFAELLIVSQNKGSGLASLAVQVAKHMRYYASVASSMGPSLAFVVETIAFDIASMCQTAFLLSFDNNFTSDRILRELLSMFDFLHLPAARYKDVSEDPECFKNAMCKEFAANVDSIGRACSTVATLFMEHDEKVRAYAIALKFRGVYNYPALLRIRNKLESVVERDFWEINDRGANFDYLPDSRRKHLAEFFLWVQDQPFVDNAVGSRTARDGGGGTDAKGQQPHARARAAPLMIKHIPHTGSQSAFSNTAFDVRKQPEEINKFDAAAQANNATTTAMAENELNLPGFDPQSLSAITRGAGIMKRKLKRIRDAKSKFLAEKNEQQRRVDSVLVSKERVLSLSANLAPSIFSRADAVSKREGQSADSPIKRLARGETGSLSLIPIPTHAQETSIGNVSRAHNLRTSRKGSAHAIESMLQKSALSQDASEKTFRRRLSTGMWFRRKSSVVTKSAIYTLQRSMEKLKEEDEGTNEEANLVESSVVKSKDDGRKTPKNYSSVWQRYSHVVPILLFVGVFLLVGLDILVASARTVENFTRLSNVFDGFVDKTDGENAELNVYKADMLAFMAVILMTFLGCVVTVSTIVLQIVSTRYTPRVAVLFLRNPHIVISLISFFSGGFYVQWQATLACDAYVGQAGFALSIIVFIISFLLLLPYTAYLLQFLDAAQIFKEIGTDGVKFALRTYNQAGFCVLEQELSSEDAMREKKNKAQENEASRKVLHPSNPETRESVESQHQQILGALDQIADYSLSALRLKDKHNAFNGVDLLSAFAVSFVRGKTSKNLPAVALTQVVTQDPEFVSLSDAVITDLEVNQTWILWKALRHMLKMYNVALGDFNDAVLRISRGFRHIGQVNIQCRDLAGANLVIKFINTILQQAITQRNFRASDTIMLQYRFLLEYIMNLRRSPEVQQDASFDRQYSDIVADCATYMQHYALLSYMKGLTGTSEVIVHDLCTLAAFARHLGQQDTKDFLLETLGSFIQSLPMPDNDTAQGLVNYIPRGILRALIKLAAIFISEFEDNVSVIENNSSDAMRIWILIKDMEESTLKAIWVDFKMLGSQEYWEVSDRGTNVDALTYEQREGLVKFFALFPSFNPHKYASPDDVAKRLQKLKN